jgi:hypothetical protein
VLQLVDESIEAFLRASVPLDPGEVAISFDAPDRQWSAAISQPTVNVVLFNIHRDPEKALAGVEDMERDGVRIRRRPLPRIELSYLITAWTSELRDEHQLIGEVMRAVLATRTLGPPHLRPPLDRTDPLPTMTISPGGSKAQQDLWKAIDGQLKPGLEVSVALPIDTGLFTPTAAPPDEVEVTTTDRHRPRMRPSVRRGVAGRIVDDARPLVNPPVAPIEIDDGHS